jgi:hypothetical protein
MRLEMDDEARMTALRKAIADGVEGLFADGPTAMAELRKRIVARAQKTLGMARADSLKG